MPNLGTVLALSANVRRLYLKMQVTTGLQFGFWLGSPATAANFSKVNAFGNAHWALRYDTIGDIIQADVWLFGNTGAVSVYVVEGFT